MDQPDGPRARRRRAVVTSWLGALLLLAAPATFPGAGAAFTGSTSDESNSVATGTVAAPSDLTATQTCSTTGITFRGATSNISSGTGALTLSTPVGTLAGDILVAHVTNRYDGSSGLTASSGTWTLIGARTSRGSGASGITAAVYWKRATGSEPASVTFTLGGSNTSNMAGGLAAYGGVNQTTPVNVFTVSTGSNSSISLPSLSPTVANVRLIDAITKENEAQSSPAGSAERWRVLSPSAGTNQGSTVSDKTVAATGPTGSRTASGASSGEWIAHAFALQPAPSTPSASLTWTASATSNATGYKLERVVSGSVTRTWTVTPIATASTTDGPLVNGTAYTYRLWAYSGTWVSPTVTALLTPSC